MLPLSVARPGLAVIERRQSHCPHCPNPQRADRFSVTVNGVRVIGYQCAVCQHVWHVTNKPELVSRNRR